MTTELTLHQQRKRLNHIFDTLINNTSLSEKEFDKMMQEWIVMNQKLEQKEATYDLMSSLNFQNQKNKQFAYSY